MEDSKKSGVSFGFSKRTDHVVLKASALGDGGTQLKETKDYLLSVEDHKINSVNPVEEKAPLVIPLLQNNRWRNPLKPDELDDSKSERSKDAKELPAVVKKTGDSIADAAVQEILEDAARLNETPLAASINSTIAIPLLLKNKVPDGYETDEHFDVSLRPDEATADDYDKVPIEQFGMALLRGMGWKDGDGIGKNKRVVKPIDPVIRPKGLGLGADKSVALQTENSSRSSRSDAANDETLTLKSGAYCQLVSGKKEGQYGTVSGIDGDNGRVMVTLALNNEVVNVTQFAIKLVTKTEFSQFSKYLNKSKVDRYKSEVNDDGGSREKHKSSSSSKLAAAENDNGGKSRRRSPSDRSNERETRDSKRSRSDGRANDTEKERSYREDVERDNPNSRLQSDRGNRSDTIDKKQSKKRKDCDEDSSEHKSRRALPLPTWLRPHLRVRIIDKSYRKGKYYKAKVTVVDVASQDSCICRTDDGLVLDDLSQSHLETVIPHQTSSTAYVMIVSGKYRSQLAQLLERDKDRSTAVVQLLSDRDVALTLDFDAICEYAADVAADDFDY